jgi:cytochrome c-type biogenesis protein
MIELGPAGFAAAFAAGFVSFLSPCVLPLVPGYLSLVSGVSFGELGAKPRRVALATAAFIGGFATIFVLLGAGAAWFGDVLLTNRRTLEIAAGAFIIFAGLVLAGVRLPISLLKEKKLHIEGRGGYAMPVVVGFAFGIGWTPCIGPTLAAILALAAAGGSPAQGAALLAVYAVGLGVPFLLFGLGFTRMLSLTDIVRRHRAVIGYASGGLLVAFGVLLATGTMGQLTAELAGITGIQI